MWKQHELLRLLVVGMLLVAPRETDATVIVTVNGAGAYINVLFTTDYFIKFYDCLCGNRQTCTARFFGDVNEIDLGNSNDFGNNDNSIHYHCAYEYFSKIRCEKANSTDVGDNYDTFHVSESQCSYSCVTLIWSYDQEGIDFSNTELNVQQCDDDCVCAGTTTTTTTLLLTTPTTTTTPETSATNDSDSDAPLDVIIGVLSAALIIAIIIAVVALICWKRTYKLNTSYQENKNNVTALAEINSPESTPQNRFINTQTDSSYRVADSSPYYNYLDAHNTDITRDNDGE